jgi:hypothetical protein
VDERRLPIRGSGQRDGPGAEPGEVCGLLNPRAEEALTLLGALHVNERTFTLFEDLAERWDRAAGKGLTILKTRVSSGSSAPSRPYPRYKE